MSKFTHCVVESERVFGGQYAPESLIDSLNDLQVAFSFYWNDINWRHTFDTYLAEMRFPSRLQLAQNITKIAGGAQIYLKREDLNFSGSHAITNALGQALLARTLGKTTILAETGSGTHGVATAAVCEKLNLECIVYIGITDARARPDQVQRMKKHGAKVVEVTSGDGTIRDAITAVLRAAVEQYETAYPLLGGPYGPRPLPTIAHAFQSLIGNEVEDQMLKMTRQAPDAIVACAGIHSPGVGLFNTFARYNNVRMIAVEGAGNGLDTDLHAAVLTHGSPGVYHGAYSMVLQDINGQIEKVHSIAPNLRYPAISPWLAKWNSEGRIEPIAITDDEATFGRAVLGAIEEIDCSIEDGHAIMAGMSVAGSMTCDEHVVICLEGGA